MKELQELFLNLVKIPSPSGTELKVGRYIQSYLNKIGIKSEFDNSGKINNSDSGNLIAKIKGNTNLPTILFAAHMDTVETGDIPIKPRLTNGIVRSDGTTILGADDKAAVASLLEALRKISGWKKRPTVISVFTTREENGIMGSSLLNLTEKIEYCFNIDGPNNLGDFVIALLGEIPFQIIIKGKAAHAAVEPEKGINAIKTASQIINNLPIGKDKKGNILNIGKISGGRANNIVPDEVILEGQMRSFDQTNLDRSFKDLEKIVKSVCVEAGCRYMIRVNSREVMPPACIDENHQIVSIAKKAAESLKLKLTLGKGSFSADANFLAQKYPTITICRGSKNPHSFDEFIGLQTLKGLRDLIIEIVKQSMTS